MIIRDSAELRKIIGIAVGRASMCWEDVEQAGIFESVKAAKIIEEVAKQIEDLSNG